MRAAERNGRRRGRNAPSRRLALITAASNSSADENRQASANPARSAAPRKAVKSASMVATERKLNIGRVCPDKVNGWLGSRPRDHEAGRITRPTRTVQAPS
jgi:hypothetical protein